MADKEKKLGDEVFTITGPYGGQHTVAREQLSDISDAGWEKLKSKHAPVRDPTPEESAGSAARLKIAKGREVIALNGATRKQVQEGGTPGTYPTSGALGVATAVGEGVVAAGEAIDQTVADVAKNPVLNPISGIVNASGSTMPSPADPSLPTGRGGETAPALADDGSASAAVRTPGGDPGNYEPKVHDYGPEAGAAAVKAGREHAFQLGEMAKAKAQIGVEQMKLVALEDQQAADILENEAVAQNRMKEYENHFSELKAAQSKLDPTIDPNRYWKNKDAGQIALGAIAGALFGFAGKGMEYLNTIQNEVRMDIDAQKQSYDNASSKIRQQMADTGDEYARARQRGLSEREAKAAAYVSKVSAIKAHVQATATNAESVEVQGKAAEALAGLDQLNIAAVQDGAKAASEAAARAKSANAAQLSARAAMINANTHAAQSMIGGGKPDKVIQNIDAAATNMNNSLQRAIKKIKEKGTFELIGPEQNELALALHDYAVDSAKLKDPSSTVRESEIERELKALGVEPGTLTTRNSTAITLLENAMNAIEGRRKAAYDAHSRGDYAPQQESK